MTDRLGRFHHVNWSVFVVNCNVPVDVLQSTILQAYAAVVSYFGFVVREMQTGRGLRNEWGTDCIIGKGLIMHSLELSMK